MGSEAGMTRTPDSEIMDKEIDTLQHAIIVTGGKQYRVAEGDLVFIEKLPVEAGETVTFDQVLAVVNDEAEPIIGTPTVAGATVTAKVVKNGKGKKIRVFKYKAKKNYRRHQGHRQPYTQVQIDAITVG